MHRLVVLVLIASLGSGSLAFAGETLQGVATRVARDAASSQARSAVATPVQKNWLRRSLAESSPGNGLPSSALGQEQPALSSSGMSKRTKILLFLSTAVGVVAVAYAIDHRVEDNTPSSLGIRQD